MSASTVTCGYPVHRVARFARWTNQYGVRFTDWTAACGFADTATGHPGGYSSPSLGIGPFHTAGSARRLELCPTCFPGRVATGPGSHFPDPIEIPSERGVK